MIDSHCHLSDERMYQNATGLIGQAIAASVQIIQLAGTDSADWARQLALKEQFPDLIRTSAGIHPWKVESFRDDVLDHEIRLLKDQVLNHHALGECGLDFGVKRDQGRFAAQERVFRQQLELAKEANRAVILHVVKSHERVIKIIHEHFPEGRYLVHSYSGSAEQMRQWFTLDAFISFSGNWLRVGRNQKVKEAILEIPLDRILLETDSPDQSWDDHPNTPAKVAEIYEAVASNRNVPLNELTKIIEGNFKHWAYGLIS